MLHSPAWLHVARSSPVGLAGYLLLAARFLATCFSEELVMRGYLIARLERLLRSTPLAVAVAALLFGSYHIYQGITPAIEDVAVGVVYAVWFCCLRRLWPLVAAHTLHNFLLYC
jgi:membrane protease YdiL (CAAX protease family)